jgi:hypothetical protein
MRALLPALTLLVVAACKGDTDDTGEKLDTADTVPDDTSTEETDDTSDTDDKADAYAFSRYGSDSSVAYDGQIARHLLIVDLTRYVGGLTARLNGGSYFPEAGEVRGDLEFYYRFDSAVGGEVPFLYAPTPAALQTTYNDVSVGKDLAGKIAGNDATGQHKAWATDFVGYGTPGQYSPEGLTLAWLDELDAAAVAWANGDIPLGPTGEPVPNVFVTADGRDLQQLLQKFLTGAVAYSQGTDDYLDDATENHGLNTPNARDGENPWTKLEHQWDEGFGYFGAARHYGNWDDSLIAGAAAEDTWDADGKIDLLTEVSWGHSTNAGKRDLGADPSAPTDLTGAAWEGFVKGRAVIAAAEGELSAEERTELLRWRDQAVSNWEMAIVATVVHYLNDCMQDLAKAGTADYDFGAHAKHWSELKGFALSLQFNPHSPLTAEEFAQLHALIGDAPVLPNAGETAVQAHIEDLREARGLLADVFAIDAANVGDEEGTNGW